MVALYRQRLLIMTGSFISLTLLIIGLALYGAQRRNPTAPASDRLTVAATIFPLADIARQVGGDYVNVVLVIPPGASEHAGDLAPQQLQNLQRARALFQIGHGLEDQLTARITNAIPALLLVTVDHDIALREFEAEEEHEEDDEESEEADHHHDAGVDPHYWLTVPNGKLIAETISQTLQELDPANAAHYQQQTTNYLAELDALEEELQTQAQQMQPKQFIAMHNAWSYFADHYGLSLVATYEPIEGQQPSLQDLQRLQEIIAQFNLDTFYTEPQKQSTGATRLLAEDLSLTIKVLDPVGGTESRDSYINLLRANLATLASQ